MLIAAFSYNSAYTILGVKDIGTTSPTVIYQINCMYDGQPFSLVSYDNTFLFAVGRAIDLSGNELAFHHLKFRRADGTIASGTGYFKLISSPSSTTSYMLIHSDKTPTGTYVWSCGYYNNGGIPTAIYSVLD